jgi:hypothetical protein
MLNWKQILDFKEKMITMNFSQTFNFKQLIVTSTIILIAITISFGLSNILAQQAKASSLPLLNSFQHGFSNDISWNTANLGGASSAKIIAGPWAMDGWNTNNNNWLTSFKEPANHDKIPYIYMYEVAGKARTDWGLQDCNVGAALNDTLCARGAEYIRQKSTDIAATYASVANQIKQTWGTTRPIMIHMEPDFYQYAGNANTQLNGPITQAQAHTAMNQWTDSIKTVLPNAVLVMDISPWNGNLAGWSGGFRNFDYAGMVGKRFPAKGDGSVNPAGIDGKTYAQMSQMTGKKLIINDAHGAGGVFLSYINDWANQTNDWENRANVQARWDDGVVAVLMPPNNNQSLESTIQSFAQNPIPAGSAISSSSIASSSTVLSSSSSSIIPSSSAVTSSSNSSLTTITSSSVQLQSSSVSSSSTNSTTSSSSSVPTQSSSSIFDSSSQNSSSVNSTNQTSSSISTSTLSSANSSSNTGSSNTISQSSATQSSTQNTSLAVSSSQTSISSIYSSSQISSSVASLLPSSESFSSSSSTNSSQDSSSVSSRNQTSNSTSSSSSSISSQTNSSTNSSTVNSSQSSSAASANISANTSNSSTSNLSSQSTQNPNSSSLAKSSSQNSNQSSSQNSSSQNQSSQLSSSSQNSSTRTSWMVTFADKQRAEIELLNPNCSFSLIRELPIQAKFVEFRGFCPQTLVKTYWLDLDSNKDYKMVKFNPTNNSRKYFDNATITKELKNGKLVVSSTHLIVNNGEGDYDLSDGIWDPYSLEVVTVDSIIANPIMTPTTNSEVKIINLKLTNSNPVVITTNNSAANLNNNKAVPNSTNQNNITTTANSSNSANLDQKQVKENVEKFNQKMMNSVTVRTGGFGGWLSLLLLPLILLIHRLTRKTKLKI